jgi:uncharacterized protein (DUF58 family)
LARQIETSLEHRSFRLVFALEEYAMFKKCDHKVDVRTRLRYFLNRGLPDHVTIDLTMVWPLAILPVLLIGQLLTPHPAWMTLLIVLPGLYLSGYWWVRTLATGMDFERRRQGTLLVAGDLLEEEFVLVNRTRLPIIWAEFDDRSDMPGYDPSRVVSVGVASRYRWRTSIECRRRGVFHLGPSHLLLADLFHLFRLTIAYPHSQQALIYPRVLQLPEIALPRGQAGGEARRRRPLFGTVPAASVRDYFPGDALRTIHWRSTAHRGSIMVREAELEPSGDVWIILDLNGAGHSGSGETSTLEYAIVLAASLTANLLAGSERRAVGLLAVTGEAMLDARPSADGEAQSPLANRQALERPLAPPLAGVATENQSPLEETGQATDRPAEALWVPPMAGQAQLWRILAALAPAGAGAMPLGELLRRSGPVLGHRRTLIVVTADLTPATGAGAPGKAAPWPAELVRLRAAGLASSVLLVAGPEQDAAARQDRETLAQVDIPSQVLPVDAKLPPLITYRRTRTVVRSTPTGGVVTYEVEEEVG